MWIILKVIDIALRMIDLRHQYSSWIVDLAKEAVSTGEPIIRPIWWIDPSDDEAMKIDSGDLNEFSNSIYFQFYVLL